MILFLKNQKKKKEGIKRKEKKRKVKIIIYSLFS
jgi:hypothetical protein